MHHTEIVRLLLESGVNPDSEILSPLQNPIDQLPALFVAMNILGFMLEPENPQPYLDFKRSLYEDAGIEIPQWLEEHTADSLRENSWEIVWLLLERRLFR